jgi:rare lipoprotein A
MPRSRAFGCMDQGGSVRPRRLGAGPLRAGGAGLLALALVPGVLATPAQARTDPSRPIRTVHQRTVVEVPFRTLYRDSKDVPPGEERVVRPGRTGLVARSYRLTFAGSRLLGRLPAGTEVLQTAVDRVVLRGPWPALGYRECGTAAWGTGSGLAALHRYLPLGTEVTVTDRRTGRQVLVIINGRGPFAAGRVIDLSLDAFAAIASPADGLEEVCLSWS